jgi:hypothetical protein
VPALISRQSRQRSPIHGAPTHGRDDPQARSAPPERDRRSGGGARESVIAIVDQPDVKMR